MFFALFFPVLRGRLLRGKWFLTACLPLSLLRISLAGGPKQVNEVPIPPSRVWPSNLRSSPLDLLVSRKRQKHFLPQVMKITTPVHEGFENFYSFIPYVLNYSTRRLLFIPIEMDGQYRTSNNSPILLEIVLSGP
jgi:hypothetical protein